MAPRCTRWFAWPLLAALATAIALPGLARAERGSAGGVHAHDGFMARLSGGFGSGLTRASGTDSVGNVEREHSGFAGALSLDIGGAPIENLIVHGRIASSSIVSPELVLDGEALGEQERSSVSAYLLGAGVSYYLMPFNLYGTLAVGFSALRFASRINSVQYARPGVAVQLDLGKEWWIGADVGVGLAARVGYAHASQRYDAIAFDADHHFLSWALLASFTWQ